MADSTERGITVETPPIDDETSTPPGSYVSARSEESGRVEANSTNSQTLLIEQEGSSVAGSDDSQEVDDLHERFIEAIKESKQWRILVYGLNPDPDEYHKKLLEGIVGVPVEIAGQIKYKFQKNGVRVDIIDGSHPDCDATHQDVDLLLVFIALRNNDLPRSYRKKIKKITDKREAMIWEHSIVVLTNFDKMADSFTVRGLPISALSVGLHGLKRSIKKAIVESNSDEEQDEELDEEQNEEQDEDVKFNVEVQIAGRQNQPDLPKPHEKWFSQLCLSCYLFSKEAAIPATLKLSQERIFKNLENSEIVNKTFREQKIQVKEDISRLSDAKEIHFGIDENTGAINVVKYGGKESRVALVGAITVGISSFGLAKMQSDIAIGGVGVEVVGAAVMGNFSRWKKQQKIVRQSREYYAELFTRLPLICKHLLRWAERQTTCKIVVAGLKQEDVSTLAAALTSQERKNSTTHDHHTFFWQGLEKGRKANLIVHEYSSLPGDSNADINNETKELCKFVRNKDFNLLIFCIKISESFNKEEFANSPHMRYLDRLQIDKDIFSKLVIGLTHADKLRNVHESQKLKSGFQEFFTDEIKGWKKEIGDVFKSRFSSNSEAIVTPVGNCDEYTIDISDNNAGTPRYHWLSKLLLTALPATKPEGIPTLIKANRKKIEESLKQRAAHDQQQTADLDNVPELIVKAQCSMFSHIGFRDFKYPGKAIGYILGEREDQTW